MIGFGFILALAGIILLIIGAAQAAQNRAFRNAQTVTGTVIYKHSHKQKYGIAYLLKLSYTVDGTEYEREVGVTLTEYDAIELGDRYEVQYRPTSRKEYCACRTLTPKS